MLIRSAGAKEARVARPPLAILLLAILIAALVGAACLGNDDDAAPGGDAGSAQPAAAGADSGERLGTGAGLAAVADSAPPDGESPPTATSAPAPAVAAPVDTIAEPVDPPAADPEPLPDAASIPPVEAMIFVEPAQTTPGQVFVLAIDAKNASAASVALDGQFISMAREGDRFYTILPLPVGTPPGPLSMVVAIADLAGALTVQELVHVEVLPGDFPVELVEIDVTLARLLDPAVIAADRAVRDPVQSVRSPLRFWQGYFHVPTEGVITSEFGLLRSYNGADPTDFHSGLDFAGALGTEVFAGNAGVVAWTGETERRGRGVIIDHGGGVFTSYWHLANVATEPGTAVAAGALIGRIGNTGLSTGAHLHWELTVYGVPVDPLPWLRELEVPNPLAPFSPLQAVNRTATTAVRP